MTLSFRLALAIPVIAFATGFALHQSYGLSLLSSAAGGLIVMGALTGLSLGVVPLLFAMAGLHSLVTSPLVGLRRGWSEGLFSIFSYTYETLFGLGETRAAGQGVNTMLPQPLFGIYGVDYNEILQQIGEQTINATRTPISEEQFQAMQLSELDIRRLQENRVAPLNADEITMLESVADIVTTLEAYKNLQRLGTDVAFLSIALNEKIRYCL